MTAVPLLFKIQRTRESGAGAGRREAIFLRLLLNALEFGTRSKTEWLSVRRSDDIPDQAGATA